MRISDWSSDVCSSDLVVDAECLRTVSADIGNRDRRTSGDPRLLRIDDAHRAAKHETQCRRVDTQAIRLREQDRGACLVVREQFTAPITIKLVNANLQRLRCEFIAPTGRA